MLSKPTPKSGALRLVAATDAAPSYDADREALPHVLVVSATRDRYAALPARADVAPDEIEALANAITTRYDAIIADVSLADGRESGYDLARRLRVKHRIACPIYLVCDYPPLHVDRVQAQRCGADALVQRDPQRLAALLAGDAVQLSAVPQPSQPSWLPKVVELARLYLASEADRRVPAIHAGLAARQPVVEWQHVIDEVSELVEDLEDRLAFTRLAQRRMPLL